MADKVGSENGASAASAATLTSEYEKLVTLINDAGDGKIDGFAGDPTKASNALHWSNGDTVKDGDYKMANINVSFGETSSPSTMMQIANATGNQGSYIGQLASNSQALQNAKKVVSQKV